MAVLTPRLSGAAHGGSKYQRWPALTARVARCSVLLLLALSLAAPRASGAGHPGSEYPLKAAFILNFARFVEWPAEKASGRELIIGILGEDPFGSSIDETVRGKLIDQRPIKVVRLETTAAAAKCDLVFIAASEADHLRQILDDVRGKPVLTVSDIENFARAGGMIGLKKRQEMIRFEINRAAAEAAGLRVSSKLLKLSDK